MNILIFFDFFVFHPRWDNPSQYSDKQLAEAQLDTETDKSTTYAKVEQKQFEQIISSLGHKAHGAQVAKIKSCQVLIIWG